LVNFAAGPGQGFGTLNFADAVRGEFDPGLVDGAVVLIGDVRSVVDQFRIPLAEGLCPGVYYHANVVNQILTGAELVEWPADRSPAPGVVFALATLAGWYFWNLREWWALSRGWLVMAAYFAVGGAAFLGGWWQLCLAAFRSDIVLPAAAPLAAVGAVMVSALVWQLAVSIISARRLTERSRQIESLFGRAVSPQVLQVIQAAPASIARTEVREVTVLFCDIRGFTTASAELGPEEVAAMLNEYFESITSAIFEQDGFVDKFVGDELMAVFNVPLEQEDHAMRAARAARSIKRRLAELNVKRTARGQEPLDCGVGLHCGPAAVGHIGTAQRANYTVVGDTVNLAARIEEQTTGGEILISEALRERLDHSVDVREWGAIRLRGGTHTLRLFQLEWV
jgi:adenylate cyclase